MPSYSQQLSRAECAAAVQAIYYSRRDDWKPSSQENAVAIREYMAINSWPTILLNGEPSDGEIAFFRERWQAFQIDLDGAKKTRLACLALVDTNALPRLPTSPSGDKDACIKHGQQFADQAKALVTAEPDKLNEFCGVMRRYGRSQQQVVQSLERGSLACGSPEMGWVDGGVKGMTSLAAAHARGCRDR